MPNAPAQVRDGAGLDDTALDRLLASGAIALPDLTTRRSEFKFHTAAATAGDDSNPDTGNPRVHAIGSSTIRDLQGDTMDLTALNDMQKAPPGLAIFVNHSYEIPEDVVGRLFDYPSMQMKRDIADLALDIELLANVNPRAKQLHAGILAGVRQGVSIGCMITAAQWCDNDGNPVPDDEIDWWDIIEGRIHLNILGVDPLEWSFVGIPANQRSWVQYAAQGLFRRSLRDVDVKSAQRLAPLVRAWFPQDYQRDVIELAGTDPALRKTLSETAPRRGDGKQILWLPEKATFGMRNPQTKRMQEMTRDRVAALLAGEPMAVKHVTTSEPEVETKKQATGKSDWPLGERDAAWDNGAAHKRIVDWAGGTDDPDTGKLKSVHFFSPDDSDDLKSVSKYKLLFCDVVDGSVKAIPKAIMACWGGHGVEATTGISAEDKEAIKKKISAYAARMRKEFDDDTIIPPWDKEDAGEPEKTAGDSMPDAKDVSVASDGTHVKCKGEHEHDHSAMGSQGSDDMHGHPHSHDGDASHDHHPASETQEAAPAPDVQKASESASMPDAGDVEVKPDGTHEACMGTHKHLHTDGAGGDHEHPHDHKGEANHGDHPHDGSEKGIEEADIPVRRSPRGKQTSEDAQSDDPARTAALQLAQTLARTYGFTVMDGGSTQASGAANPDGTARKCMLVDNDADAQKVITYMSAMDTALDEAESYSDRLMALLNIPDVDEDDDTGAAAAGGDNSDVAGPRFPAESSASVSGRRLLTRAGARHSATDMDHLQTIHDAVYALTDGSCCTKANETPESEGDNADGTDTANGTGGGESQMGLDEAQHLLGGGSTSASASVLPALLASMTDMASALKSLALPALQGQVDALVKSVDAAKATQDTLIAEQQQVTDAIARLRGTPQGRPTTMQRSFTPSAASDPNAPIPAVTAASLTPEGQAAESAHALQAAKAQTSTQYVAGVGPCRLWPEGVGKDVRPTLSQLQRLALEAGFQSIRRALPTSPDGTSQATSAESLIAAYQSGGAALIPIVMDGD